MKVRVQSSGFIVGSTVVGTLGGRRPRPRLHVFVFFSPLLPDGRAGLRGGGGGGCFRRDGHAHEAVRFRMVILIFCPIRARFSHSTPCPWYLDSMIDLGTLPAEPLLDLVVEGVAQHPASAAYWQHTRQSFPIWLPLDFFCLLAYLDCAAELRCLKLTVPWKAAVGSVDLRLW